MKPWPEFLIRMFPQPEGVVPDRPWYTFWGEDPREGSRWVRLDLVTASQIRLRQTVDREHPMKFPGIRPGQLWWHSGTGRYTHGFIRVEGIDGDDRVSMCNLGADLRAFLPGGLHTRVDDMVPVLSQCFLLADPVCHHLRFWAPSEDS